MKNQDFTTTLTFDQSPEEVFKAVTNVRAWWSEEITGGSAKQGDEFDYHYEDMHRCHVVLTEVIPNEKVVWFIKENYFKFTEDHEEWTDTHIDFEIFKSDGKTNLRVTHVGLTKEYECYDICSDAWTKYISGSLYNLITSGQGQPNGTGKPQTENEKRLVEG